MKDYLAPHYISSANLHFFKLIQYFFQNVEALDRPVAILDDGIQTFLPTQYKCVQKHLQEIRS